MGNSAPAEDSRPVDVLAEAASLGDAGIPAALVTVIRTTGSVPRRPPAKMIVLADGSILGTVGGGRIEHEAREVAKKVARRESPPTRFSKHLVRDLAMCCGGEMELWLEPLDGGRTKALLEVVRRRQLRRPCALVTALGGGGNGDGGKDVIGQDPCLADRAARLEDERFIEPVLPAERLILFGGGHVARAIAPLALRVGFSVVVCDEDEEVASAQRFPGLQRICSLEVGDIERELGTLGEGDYVVIVTREHATDQALLERLLGRSKLSYLGLIGSLGKLARFRQRLEAKGLGDADLWRRLHAPIGIAIGAETPEEIALSIVAELVKVRHQGP